MKFWLFAIFIKFMIAIAIMLAANLFNIILSKFNNEA